MRKTLLWMTAAVLITACGNSEQKAAEQLLNEARAHFGQGDIDAARADIDSLRKTYPNIVAIRKGALELHQEVELKAAQDELLLTDSLLLQANTELDNLQKEVEAHKAALKATPEELTLLTRTRMRRDSIRTQYETLGAKIRYIRKKMGENQKN